MDDVVFGSQFLNGCNPNFIKRCEVLPKNFPVTEEMVKDFLDRGKSLDNEMKVYSEFLYEKLRKRISAGERSSMFMSKRFNHSQMADKDFY